MNHGPSIKDNQNPYMSLIIVKIETNHGIIVNLLNDGFQIWSC